MDRVDKKMAKQSGGRPTTKRAAEIKATVVAATLEAFIQKGSAFSMDEVALLAGVSKQAIYRRWRTKIDLVVEVVETFLNQWFDRSLLVQNDTVGLAGPDPVDPVEALEALARQHFANDPIASNRLGAYLQAESFHNERLHDRMVEWHERFVDAYSAALLDIDAAGRRVSGGIRIQAQLLVELLSGGTHWLALTGSTSSSDKWQCFDQRWNAFKRIAIC